MFVNVCFSMFVYVCVCMCSCTSACEVCVFVGVFGFIIIVLYACCCTSHKPSAASCGHNLCFHLPVYTTTSEPKLEIHTKVYVLILASILMYTTKGEKLALLLRQMLTLLAQTMCINCVASSGSKWPSQSKKIVSCLIQSPNQTHDIVYNIHNLAPHLMLKFG